MELNANKEQKKDIISHIAIVFIFLPCRPA